MVTDPRQDQVPEAATVAETIDPRNAYIRIKAGAKGGRGNVLDRGWGRKDEAIWQRLDITKVRRHAERGGNLAILTGKRSGHFTIDVDPKNGGMETLAELEAKHGPLPQTNRVRTPSGGLHLNYRLPDDFDVGNDSSGKVFGPGIDVKGEHGYRVAPGSRTATGVYVLEDDSAYEPCASWALKLLRDHFVIHGPATPAEASQQPVEKVPQPPRCCEAAARRAVAELTSALRDLARLPEEQRMPLGKSGLEVGWDDGFWRLAARLIEVARWPFSSVSLVEVEKAYFEVAPDHEGSFDPHHAWEQGLTNAGHWFSGERHRLNRHGPAVLVDKRAAPPAGANVDRVLGQGAEGGSIGDRFPILNIDILDPDRPPRAWLLEGVIPEGDHVSIVAPGGTGKSLLALALSIAAASGATQFIGRRLRLREGCKVIYVDMENSEEDWRERLRSFGVTMSNASDYWGGTFIPLSFPPLGGLDTRDGAETFLEVLDFYGVEAGDVLILDSTQRVTEGAENDNDTVRALYGLVAELKRRGVTVIRTDNTGKDPDRGARGASAKNDDVGYSWLLERRGSSDQFTLKNTKFRGLGNGEAIKFRVAVEDGRTEFLQALEPVGISGGASLERWYHDHFRFAVMDILRRVHRGAHAEGTDKSNLVTQNQLLQLARAETFDYFDPNTGQTEKKRVAFAKRKGMEWLGELASEGYLRVEGGDEVATKSGGIRVTTKYYGWLRDLPMPDFGEEVSDADDAGEAF